jgi:hypothetical protein
VQRNVTCGLLGPHHDWHQLPKQSIVERLDIAACLSRCNPVTEDIGMMDLIF